MEKKKIQVLVVRGGMTFKSQEDYLQYLRERTVSLGKKRRWHGDYLESALGGEFEISLPRMPLQDNAKYEEWKIHFEKHIPLLDDNVILIGNSLGGLFLAQYLSEHTLPKKMLSCYLVCPVFDDTVVGEDLVGGFELGNDLSLIEKNVSNLTLFFSKDDPVVPVSHADKYRGKLSDKARIIIFESKNGHFQIEEFPEIVDMIKEDVRRL